MLKLILNIVSAMNPSDQVVPKVKGKEKTSDPEEHGTIHQNKVAERDLNYWLPIIGP